MEEGTTEKPPMAEEAKQAPRRAFADMVAFGKRGQSSLTSRGGRPIEREENTEAALSNVTTWSDHSDLSDSEFELPIVTARMADDLL
ncbi:hypothetical protein NDU88_004103 [Pleurodeles waltl]|uniref:Uncharacterized protein n=1 Tax=Pleurodeles waltl TaxID=8319 RepID=A0AAV7W751_PLEWA|nr:hypothetical protein NDU88_004103 [Pleurodeles waltl]